MDTVLLTAADEGGREFTERMKSLESYITSRGDGCRRHELSDMNIHFCTGCFTCWWKTPGLCVFKDDMEALYPDILKCDLLILASPLVLGLPSWRIKQVQDRLIPLLHPYITLVGGECHHKKRYDHYPDVALIIEEEETTGTEDIQLLTTLHRRLAINFHSSFRGVYTLGASNEEVYHDLCTV